MLMRFQAFLDRGVGLSSAALSRQIIGYSVPLEIGQRGFAQSLVNATKPDRVVGSDKVRGQKNGRSEGTRLNSSHGYTSYAVFCLKKKSDAATRSGSSAGTTSTRR